MRVVLQRVSEAAVHISDECVGEIAHGFLILLGIETEDNTADADYLIQKVSQMRVFSDADGKMNLNIQEVNGSILIMSVEIENLRIDNQIVEFLKVNKTIHFNTFLHL